MSQSEICRALSMLTPQLPESGKVRVGGMCDGGYVMANRLTVREGVAYSIGVGPDTSWDVAMAEQGWTVYQYDHTVEGAPHQHPNCRFHRIGLGRDDDQPHLQRLDTLMTRNGHDDRGGHILKFDIEGHEWACLSVLDEAFFDRFDQIVCELHWLDHLHDAAFRETYFNVIGKLRRSHVCVHVHANNYADLVTTTGIAIPPVVEISFAHQACFSFQKNFYTSPGSLDIANNSAKPDIYLGLFEFPWRPQRSVSR